MTGRPCDNDRRPFGNCGWPTDSEGVQTSVGRTGLCHNIINAHIYFEQPYTLLLYLGHGMYIKICSLV